MKKYWKIFGIVALVAGIIYYPALKLYLYLAKAKTESSDRGDPGTRVKTFIPGYRGRHRSDHNHSDEGNPNATLV